jgi:hypothetical protein
VCPKYHLWNYTHVIIRSGGVCPTASASEQRQSRDICAGAAGRTPVPVRPRQAAFAPKGLPTARAREVKPQVSRINGGEPACTPDSVPRAPCGGPRRRPSLSAGGYPTALAAYPGVLVGPGSPPPFWPCSGWGLPSRPGRPRRWCALTAPFHPYLCGTPGGVSPSAVYFLWHCPAGRPDWVLPSTLPYGVRTFLGPVPAPRDGPGTRPPGRLTTSPPCYRLVARGTIERL